MRDAEPIETNESASIDGFAVADGARVDIVRLAASARLLAKSLDEADLRGAEAAVVRGVAWTLVDLIGSLAR